MSGHDGSGENLADQVRYLQAERDRYRELFEAKYSTIQAERDCYRKAMVRVLLLTENHVQTRHWVVNEIEREVRAALHPEEEE